MTELDNNAIIIREEAHKHCTEHGDKVKVKAGTDAHASYDVLRGPLTRYAYGRVGKNWMDAEDCVQDAYVKTIETAKVNEFLNFAGLYKIWLDRAIRDKRLEQRKTNEVLVEDKEIEGANGLTLIDLAESEEAPPDFLMEIQGRVNYIMDLSNGLKPKAKAIVRLVLIFGYSYKDVAIMLNVEPKRVENTLGYFKGRLM